MQKLLIRYAISAAMIAATFSQAQAGLFQSGFLVPTDGLLVNDTATNLQWLTPVYTRGQTYNNAVVQNIISTYRFRYATATEVTSMVNSNFGNPTTIAPGDVAGFNSAAQFFALFGIAQNVFCSGGACPRTQGLTSTPGGPGSQLGFGMIQLGPTGWFITNNNWPTLTSDLQMGSFLVRTGIAPEVPEPSTYAMFGLGAAGLIAFKQRRVRATLPS